MPDPRQEFNLLSRHVAGRRAPAADTPDLRTRYEAGCRALFGDPPPRSAALALALRAPVLLPLLDAGCALVRREDPLRRRLLLMAAVLEASTAHTGVFLPRTLTWTKLLVVLPLRGALAAARGVAGAALVMALPRGERP